MNFFIFVALFVTSACAVVLPPLPLSPLSQPADSDDSASAPKTWVLIAAGSNGFYNYRHQVSSTIFPFFCRISCFAKIHCLHEGLLAQRFVCAFDQLEFEVLLSMAHLAEVDAAMLHILLVVAPFLRDREALLSRSQLCSFNLWSI